MIDDDTMVGAKRAVYDVGVECYAVLGTATLPISQLLKLGRGAVVELDRKVNDPVDLYANRLHIAKAEVTIIDDHLGVTVTEVLKYVSD